VLPRADQLFAQPRQRFDYASERLGHALRRNLREHRRAFAEAATLLRPRAVASQIAAGRERVQALGQRLERGHNARLTQDRKRLESLIRVLDSVSYRGVLERGFALVRGPDGHVRRRAAAVVAGETLSVTFADGTREAVAGGTPKPRMPRPKAGQGTLF